MTKPLNSGVPTEAEVLQALGQTGFLLEQSIAARVRTFGFNAWVGRAYRDPDLNKSREMDVLGIQSRAITEGHRTVLFSYVVAECKNTINPFVAVGAAATDQERGRQPKEYFIDSDPVGELRFSGGPYSLFHHFRFSALPGHLFERSDFLGTQIVRLQRKNGVWRGDNEGIFDSVVYPLAKAVQTKLNEFEARKADPVYDPERSWISQFFPVVVTTGPVFAVNTSASPPGVSQVPWVAVARELDSDSLKGTFTIEIVNEASFDDYMKERVVRYSESLYETLEKNSDFLDRDRLLERYADRQRS